MEIEMSNYPDNMNWDAWAVANSDAPHYPNLEGWYRNADVWALIAEYHATPGRDDCDRRAVILEELEAWRGEAISEAWRQLNDAGDYMMDELNDAAPHVDVALSRAVTVAAS
jgi:hypothetical protein